MTDERQPRYILHWFCLAMLTALAGIIRFYHIDHPCLWYDESMVFWRTCGTYGQLLECLRNDGFVPLHYSLVWVISRFFQPTPLILRFVPALCGTLMVPAVYFLSRQLVDRKTSLLAAAFTACSAFMLFYSRDAKMYMDAWLFVALNIACLLWWFRSGNITAWLCWIAAGCAACGLHISSAGPVAISLLLLFTQDKMRWQQTLLWLAGVLLIFSGPIGHYEKFNIWRERADENWNESGLQWINAYNHNRTGPELVRYLGTTMATGWEWPKADDLPKIQAERVQGPIRCVEIIFVMLIAGCLPWPRRQRLAIDNPQPQWRVLLWLALLVVLPVYGFYCRSVPHFAGPEEWFSSIEQQLPSLLMRYWWLWLLIILLVAGRIFVVWRDLPFRQILLSLRKSAERCVALMLVIAVVITLCWATAIVMTTQAKDALEAGKPWESLWVPRYVGFIWPTVAISISAILMRLPGRSLRAAAIFFLLGSNLAVAGLRILGETEPPVDLMAIDFIIAQDPAHHTLIRMDIDIGMQYPGGGNLFSGPGEYYLDLFTNIKTNPLEFRTAIKARTREHRISLPLRAPRDIPRDANCLIIWSQYKPQPRLAGEDQLQNLKGWRLTSESTCYARDCWIWQDTALYRRREYTRPPK